MSDEGSYKELKYLYRIKKIVLVYRNGKINHFGYTWFFFTL